jgi:hypothetical protein
MATNIKVKHGFIHCTALFSKYFIKRILRIVYQIQTTGGEIYPWLRMIFLFGYLDMGIIREFQHSNSCHSYNLSGKK